MLYNDINAVEHPYRDESQDSVELHARCTGAPLEMNENRIKEPSMTKDTPESIILSMREQIADVDEQTVMAVAGVTQALDELRKALVEVDACLDSRDFEKAAAL